MAILSNLVVHGASRFLNTAYFNDVSISGTASLASLSLSGTLAVTGAATLSSTLAVTGASTFTGILTANNQIVGKNGIELYGSTPYIDFHYNNSTADYTSRIQETASGTLTVPKNLTVSTLLSATTGAITTLNSTTATIHTLDVSDTFWAHDFEFEIQHVVDGIMRIAPTLRFPARFNGETSTTSAMSCSKSGSTLTIVITDSSISTSSMAGIVWSSGSRVKVSGKIKGVATETMSGTISSISNGSLTVQVSGGNVANITATSTLSDFDDITIMVYERKDGNNYFPAGILINCYDAANKSPTIKVYGGTSATPNVTVGNLVGLSFNGTALPTTSPLWGIHTSMGYFEGAIVSTEGQIGGFTIGETTLKNGDLGGTTSVLMSTGTSSSTVIGGSSGSNTWAFTASNKYGVTTSGALYTSDIHASSGVIGNFTLNSGKLYSNNHSAFDTAVAGIYIGSDYISMGSSGVTYFKNDGTGKVGPWALSTTYFRNGNIANATNTTVAGVYLGTDGLNISNGTAATTSYITKSAVNIGNKLTWNGTTLSVEGTVNADAGRIGGTSGWKIESQKISSMTSGTVNTLGTDNSLFLATKNLGSNTSIAGRSGSDWRFTVGSNFGITNTGATYASTLVIGPSDGYHATVANSAFEVYNGTSQLASFGATAIIGDTSKNSITINNKILTIDNDGGSIFQVGDASDSNGVTTVTHKEYKVHSENGITVKYTVRSVISIKDEDDVSYTIRTYNNKFIETTQMLPAEKTYIATYTTLDFKPKYMTFGSRVNTNNYGNLSATFGYNNSASGYCSVATGRNNDASGEGSIAIGINSIAQATCSAAIGSVNRAYGERSVAIGYQSTVYSTDSISIGSSNTTKGEKTIALGFNCETYLGQNAIAIGSYASVNAQNSVAIGFGAKTNTAKTIAFGKYNDPGDYAIMVGNGTSDTARSNALTVDWSGNLVTSGSVSANGRILLHSALTSKGTTATTTSGCTYGVAGVTSGNRIYSKWYAYLDTGVTSLSDGMTIQIKVPVAGSGSGCGITIDGGASFHPVVYATSSVVTTHYGNGNILTLVYDSSGTGSVFGTVAGATATAAASITGVWRVLNMYDSNSDSHLRVWSSATNLNVPLIGSSSANSTTATWSTYTGTYKDWFGAIPNDDSLRPKMNLSTGVLTVPGGIVGDVTGNATTASTATTANSLSVGTAITTAANLDAFLEALKIKATVISTGVTYSNGTLTANDGAVVSIGCSSTTYGNQIFFDPDSNKISVRRKSTNWQPWIDLLHSANYTDYTVTKTGTGASGTWGISITGSSASCTGNAATATTASKISGIAGTVNANRHIWFSDSSYEDARNYDDDFMYNPSTNTLTVANVSGNAATATTAGNVTGTVTVGHGGTGATSFTANSVIMSGSSTTAALTTRSVTNNTSASAITASTNIITANTLAYWNGAYSGTTSRLAYCNQGAFGTMATKSAANYAELSGATFTGGISGTTGTFSDVVTAANIGNIQSASKSVAITSSNTIGATPAIGAQLTLTPGTYLLWGRFVFSTAGSGTSRNNRIAFYTGASPTDSTMLTESQVCVFTAARNWGALTTTYIVSPTANTTYTVGGTSSLPGPDGGMSVIKAIRLL